MRRSRTILFAAMLATLLLPAGAAARDKNKPRVHTVREGETLARIARLYGCSLAEIVLENRGRFENPDKIWPGEELRIPKCSGPRVRSRGRRLAPRVRSCRWTSDQVDTKRLKAEMSERGFRPPKKFRALVVKTRLNHDRSRVSWQRVYAYDKAALGHRGWNPASTVKLFASVGALERVKRLGFSPRVQVTYHYKRGPKTFRLDELLRGAMHESKNLPYNRLVQLAGFDSLNGPRGTLQRAGLEHSYIIRAYEVGAWAREGHSKWFKSTPKITLREGRRKRTIRARTSKTKYPCYGAACASMSDLAKMMCSMMLHEQLPASARLMLGGDGEQGKHLRVLRKAMQKRRKRGQDDVWDAFEKAFPAARGYKLFRKAGFSEDWLSDNIYIYSRRSRVRWIITLAGYPGRGSLSRAAEVIAGIIADDAL